MAGVLTVVGWDTFQHYKDRNPPWIKLYNSLLENYEYQCLQDASKSHLVGIWMLASRTNNKVPADPKWIAAHIGATDGINLQALANAGFIEVPSNTLARRKRNARPETETETETEAETETDNSVKVADVLDHYKQTHPRRTVGDEKQRKLLRKALKLGFTVEDLKHAITGNAKDPWHQQRRKHELGYVLRDADHINDFLEKYEQQEAPAEGDFFPTIRGAKGDAGK